MTNGGGVPEARRRALLSNELGVELSANQLVQSHTPLAPIMADYVDKPVLVIGGKRDTARKVAESYGLKKAVIPQDILHWNRSIWHLSEWTDEVEKIVRVSEGVTGGLRVIQHLHSHHDTL
jgi:ribonucleotide monophosphatase NagD (HAD superfamily)